MVVVLNMKVVNCYQVLNNILTTDIKQRDHTIMEKAHHIEEQVRIVREEEVPHIENQVHIVSEEVLHIEDQNHIVTEEVPHFDNQVHIMEVLNKESLIEKVHTEDSFIEEVSIQVEEELCTYLEEIDFVQVQVWSRWILSHMCKVMDFQDSCISKWIVDLWLPLILASFFYYRSHHFKLKSSYLSTTFLGYSYTICEFSANYLLTPFASD